MKSTASVLGVAEAGGTSERAPAQGTTTRGDVFFSKTALGDSTALIV
jgi:hypothetical protein